MSKHLLVLLALFACSSCECGPAPDVDAGLHPDDAENEVVDGGDVDAGELVDAGAIVCAPRIESIDGEPFQAGGIVHPNEDVVVAAVPENVLGDASAEWRFVAIPADTEAVINDAYSLSTGFSNDAGLGIDVAGVYSLAVSVLSNGVTTS